MDLSTNYLGLRLSNPLLVSASPLSAKVDTVRQLEDAGAAGVVMFSLFEEQLRTEADALSHFATHSADSHAEAADYFPPIDEYEVGPDVYLETLRRNVEAVDIPVFGSLNGVTPSGWTSMARMMEQAGAAGIELNIYNVPADLGANGRDIEERYLEVAAMVKHAVRIPVAIKLSPFFSAIGQMARHLDEVGVDGLVLFNRFYQPDFDLDKLEVVADLELSNANEIRLPLLWIALLHGRVGASLAATRGVETHIEVIKYLLAGADAVMTTSALLRHGAGYIRTLRDGLCEWMAQKNYESVDQLKGSMSRQNVADPSAFERANYIRVLENYKHAYLT